uniref:RNA-directed DNA polymerase, eukaryota n=1 Tax=Tanacetum cinerariifolium TaxID=118510 RepID=A0A699HK27_TANCI|nr:RNA-directed DNA polymerase, eukaryota [Tanacetum cinerariifolium]
MPTINDSITKSEKKSKRKHQDPEPKSEPAIETIKQDKRKKKKDELTNGSEVELTEKKKKKKNKKQNKNLRRTRMLLLLSVWTRLDKIWALESSGDFSIASVRKVIDDKSLPKVDSKTWWIKYVPIKVNVHAWKVKTDSLPTMFNVSRRGIHIDSIMFVICDKGAETSSHLFFSCCVARQTVRMITRW